MGGTGSACRKKLRLAIQPGAAYTCGVRKTAAMTRMRPTAVW
ncbi:MAG: hypothetical protein ACLT29_04910 [Ruminococcus callidus]